MKPTHWQPSNESKSPPAQVTGPQATGAKGHAAGSPANGSLGGGNSNGNTSNGNTSNGNTSNGNTSNGNSGQGGSSKREPCVWRCEHEIASEPAAGQKVLAELLSQLEAHQWLERDIFGVHLATEEAIVNAILHGNNADCNKRVHVVCVLSPDRLRVEITDEGCGFDPDALPDPTCEERIEAAGGRGVMLMRSFMSRVEFSQRGNTVVMEKVRCQGGE